MLFEKKIQQSQCSKNTFICFLTTESKEARRGEKSKEDGLHSSPALDSSYFEVPTKEGHMANNGIHEIPTKDTDDAPSQSHTTAGEKRSRGLGLFIFILT